jgi:hypothetical protein
LIILNFVVKLLLSRDLITRIEYDSILVIINKLTKYTYIILYLEASTAENLAYAFLRVIVANHSALEEMISDRNCCKLDSTLCIETSKELRTRLAEVVYEEHADQSLTKQLVTCSMDTAYPPIRNRNKLFIL